MGHKSVGLSCQKAINLDRDYTVAVEQSMTCPVCGSVTVLYPHRFRPPRKNAHRKWAVIRHLHQNVFHFHHITESASEGYVKYPNTMRDAIEFIERFKSRSGGK